VNAKKILALSIVLAALAAIVFFWEIPGQKAKEAKEMAGDQVLDIKYDAVNRIVLERGAETIEFVKDKTGEDWQMTKPVADQTERWMVQSLVSAFRFARPSRTLKDLDAGALERFGLDKPRAIITLDAGGVVKRVRVGMKNPIDNSAYVKPEDQNLVFLITDSTLSAIEKPVAEFRLHELLGLRDPGLKVSRIEIAAADAPPLTLVQEKPPKAEGTPEPEPAAAEPVWRLDGPNGPVADEEAMKAILDKVAGLKAITFPENAALDDPKYAFDKPTLKVAATYGEGEKEKTLTLTVGAREGNSAIYYAQAGGRPFIVTVQAQTLMPFQVGREGLRDRRLLGVLNPTRVGIIDLQGPKASFRISRSAKGWAFADGAPASADRADDLLRAAAHWRADELVGGPRAKRLTEALRTGETTSLTLLDAEGKALATLRFSAPIDPVQFAPLAPPTKAAAPAAKAAEATPAETPAPGKANEKERLVVLVEGGYPDTVYLTPPKTLADLPASVDEMKAQLPAAEEPAGAGASPEGK